MSFINKHHTDESRAKTSISAKVAWTSERRALARGKKRSAETTAKIVAKQIGKIQSVETRQKISIALKSSVAATKYHESRKLGGSREEETKLQLDRARLNRSYEESPELSQRNKDAWSKLTEEERSSRIARMCASRSSESYGERTPARVAALDAVHESRRGISQSTEHREKIGQGVREFLAQLSVEQLHQRTALAVQASRLANPSSLEIDVMIFLTSQKIDFIHSYRIGRYVVDFWLPNYSLIVECDGDYWHKNRQEHDAKRDVNLRNAGFQILRLSEAAIKCGDFSEILTTQIKVLYKTKEMPVLSQEMVIV